MGQGIYKITDEFEEELVRYTGAKYAITIDNASNALFLALMYVGVKNTIIEIPSHTYPSVPCEIIHAGASVKFNPSSKSLTGAYQLKPTPVWDSALRFTHNMYIPGSLMCLSFTGPYKHLKLGKGGAILTDCLLTRDWLRRARFSGRREVNYHEDYFDMLGWNFYMMPEIAARGLLLIKQFYDVNGNPKNNEDLTLPYPDLSQYEIYNQEKFNES